MSRAKSYKVALDKMARIKLKYAYVLCGMHFLKLYFRHVDITKLFSFSCVLIRYLHMSLSKINIPRRSHAKNLSLFYFS